jgi:hypothetical protein
MDINQVKSEKLSNKIALNCLALNNSAQTQVLIKPAKNVIFCCDVSGSMYRDLSKMRTQLKNRIPDLIGENDTISIIWFSGRTQAGILKEGVKVNNPVDLQNLNSAIDRFLVPVGLTAFLKPLELTEEIIGRLDNGNQFSFVFLSDGYNNDAAWSDIMKQLNKLDSQLASATFIEFGYYADSNALTEMAEAVGGEKIFSQDFDSYELNFEKILGKDVSKKQAIDISFIKDKLTYQFFFTIDAVNEIINVYSCKGKDEVLVPENIIELYFFTMYKPTGSQETSFSYGGKLAASYVLADRLRYNHVEDIIFHLGDIELSTLLNGAYGKQKLNEFKGKLKDKTFGITPLFDLGKSEGFKPDPKAYCFMNLIEDLSNGENFFFPYHPDFNYNRIGAKSVTKTVLNEEQQKALTSAKTLKEVEKITNQIEVAEFIYPDNAAETGMNFDQLVWNSDRANLSVLTRLQGTVKLPKNEFKLEEIDSFIYRSYTFVKDGILNVTQIPVKLDEDTFIKLQTIKSINIYNLDNLQEELSWNDKDIFLLDFSKLPIINRSMTVNISGKKLAMLEFELENCKLAQKYIKSVKEEHDPKTNFVSAEKYSKEAADWLKEIGVSDSNGFSPKTEKELQGDVYMSTVLKVKIEKMSTQPKVKDVVDKISNSDQTKVKYNNMETLMKSQINELSPKFINGKKVDINTLNSVLSEIDKERKRRINDIATIKFGLILSRQWFSEFESIDENELTMKFPTLGELKVKFEYKDEEVKI